ncbi:hypothetical protein PROFUN_09168 [Planoprotostelium fungivorum]|uniref:Ubiquitin-like domain-containing protein n=1 Tax=Planoprotostelium fungivorum TaxID=1890364 RepID=A0A2P6MVM3_9EUKA|nr:hypothetical protein PROFUN_09168 [Planoprotostelium fungivorum]
MEVTSSVVSALKRRNEVASVDSEEDYDDISHVSKKIKRLTLPPHEDQELLVKTLSGKTTTMRVTSTDRVHNIKTKLEEMEGIPWDQQRLIFCTMGDDRLVFSYDITEGSIFHLVIALRGGS